MFDLTTKSRYGLSAILEIAKSHGHNRLQVKDIAARHNISPQYLEQLLSRLLRSGLVRAIRGQKGGYVLARPPYEITLMEVLEALEGPLAIARTMPQSDEFLEFAQQTEAAVRRALNFPLSDVLARQEARAVMFHI
jgi:Rrf2 family protein